MKEKDFEQLVIEAIAELPYYFREKMENITIHIEDFPDNNILRKLGHNSPYSILGLYQGIPFTRRGIHYGNVLPDRVLIFRKPILSKCKSTNKLDIKNEIKRVVVHEIGHYFGLSEQELYVIEKNLKKEQRKGD